MIAVPLQMHLLACEVLFILDNKLRIQKEDFNVPAMKCELILEDVLDRFLCQMDADTLFTRGPPLSTEALRRFAKAADHESLQFEAASFEKVSNQPLPQHNPPKQPP